MSLCSSAYAVECSLRSNLKFEYLSDVSVDDDHHHDDDSSSLTATSSIRVEIEGLDLIQGVTVDSLNNILANFVPDDDSSFEEASYANDSMDKARAKYHAAGRVISRESFISADSIDLARQHLQERSNTPKDQVPAQVFNSLKQQESMTMDKDAHLVPRTKSSNLDDLVPLHISNRAA